MCSYVTQGTDGHHILSDSIWLFVVQPQGKGDGGTGDKGQVG